MNDSLQILCNTSTGFHDWLARAGGSLVVSTYQAGKVAMIGWNGAQVTLLMREFDKPLGIATSGNRLLLATRNEVTIFANAKALAFDFSEERPGAYDALYVPRVSHHTADLHTHDVAFCGSKIYCVATRFSCLAELSDEFNFKPVWKPRFVSDLVPEDRCHLNGLAIRDGRPRYMTALGETDAPGAWRERKADGGLLIDVESNEIIARGLSMPHTPRWHDGKLWVLNSGAGELLVVDPFDGRREVVCRLPGYLRGMAFVGDYAVIGMCKIREKHIFGGLPVQAANERLLCGLTVVDLRSGETVGQLEFTQGCEELYDVRFLAGIYRPMLLNLARPESRQAMTNPESSFWLRPSNEMPLNEAGAARAVVA